MIGVFNNGYLISLLLFMAGSLGSFCDGLIVSKGFGVAELAAVGIVYPYIKTMECISLLFSGGSQIIISRKIGQNKFEEVSKVFYTSMISITVISVIIAVAINVVCEPFCEILGASESGLTLRPTMDYLKSLAIGAPAHLLSLYLIPLFQLDERKKLINIATTVMTVVNISLNILFMICGFGIKGIGYSTSISYYVALMILSIHFLEKKQGILLCGKFAVCKEYLSETIREGAPSAFKNVSSIIFNTVVNNILAAVGTTEAMAAFSVWKMTKFIFLSVSEAIIGPVRMIQPMLWEEKDRKMLREIFKYSILKGVILSTVLSALLWIFGRSIFSVMISGNVLDETVSLMRWSTVIYILNTFICYYLAYFQAIKKRKTIYSISVVLNIVILPIFYLLGKNHGSKGVWISFALQFVITAAYVLICAYVMGRKNTKLIDKLLVLPTHAEEDYEAYDFCIKSSNDAEIAANEFCLICKKSISDRKKAYYCSLALEEIIFNILEYQKANNEPYPNIDVHIIIHEKGKMVMRVKDCSRERNPFVKYEYSRVDDELENMGIKIVKSFAEDINYSFVYGVNFITITV